MHDATRGEGGAYAPRSKFDIEGRNATPHVDVPGNLLFLNDGYIQLDVAEIRGKDVECIVKVGGKLRSRKGLNLPAIDLGIGAFTERDRACRGSTS